MTLDLFCWHAEIVSQRELQRRRHSGVHGDLPGCESTARGEGSPCAQRAREARWIGEHDDSFTIDSRANPSATLDDYLSESKIRKFYFPCRDIFNDRDEGVKVIRLDSNLVQVLVMATCIYGYRYSP